MPGILEEGLQPVLAHRWRTEESGETGQDGGSGEELTLGTPAAATPWMPTPQLPLDNVMLALGPAPASIRAYTALSP